MAGTSPMPMMPGSIPAMATETISAIGFQLLTLTVFSKSNSRCYSI